MPLETTKVTNDQGSRLVAGLMGITVLFAVIGAEVKASTGPKANPVAGLAKGPEILVGGVVATALLTLLSHGGDAGRQFAIGLALVSMTTATLVYGGPVWDAANRTFGSLPTGATGGTSPTAATSGTGSTVASTAIIATNLAA